MFLIAVRSILDSFVYFCLVVLCTGLRLKETDMILYLWFNLFVQFWNKPTLFSVVYELDTISLFLVSSI